MTQFNPLRQKVTPKAQPVYEPLPAGKYTATVKSIADWKSKENKNVEVFTWDEDFKKVVDSTGKEIKTVMDFTSYSAEVDFELTQPGFEGRTVKHWLVLHPNMPWGFPAFLDACGVIEDIFPDQVKDFCVGAEVTLDIIVKTKPKDVTNKSTGVVSQEDVTRNEVRKVLPVEYDV